MDEPSRWRVSHSIVPRGRRGKHCWTGTARGMGKGDDTARPVRREGLLAALTTPVHLNGESPSGWMKKVVFHLALVSPSTSFGLAALTLK